MRWIDASGLLAVAMLAAAPSQHTASAPAAPQATPTVSPDTALAELKAGNDHHVNKQYRRPHQTAARQRELASGQHPHAAVLSCADSRVAPEIIFDQGLGDLFDVRVAGNVAADPEIASLEYAAEHLDVPLFVVVGHQKCGAVTATIDAGDGTAPGHLPSLVNLIRPAVQASARLPGDRVDNAVRLNVENAVRQLRESKPVLEGMCAAGRIRVVGAVYSLDTGKVTWLPDQKISPK